RPRRPAAGPCRQGFPERDSFQDAEAGDFRGGLWTRLGARAAQRTGGENRACFQASSLRGASRLWYLRRRVFRLGDGGMMSSKSLHRAALVAAALAGLVASGLAQAIEWNFQPSASPMATIIHDLHEWVM